MELLLNTLKSITVDSAQESQTCKHELGFWAIVKFPNNLHQLLENF